MFVKTRLMTPGPTPTAESTRLAVAGALPHHRTPEFAAIAERALAGLRWLWDTDDALIIAGSGTAGMEAALRATVAPGQRLLAVTGGKFAERWVTVARFIGADVTEVNVAWGRSATVADVDAALAGAAPFDACVMVASETSTGALHPVAALIDRVVAHSPDVVTLVDGITAVGCVDLSMRRDRIDLLVSGSQKSFGLPPGAAVVGVSARAWARIDQTNAPNYYFDLRKERKQTSAGDFAFTPPIPLVVGFAEVMGRWQALGREGLFAHASTLSAGTLAGVAALGLRPFVDGTPSPALTAVAAIDGVPVPALRARLAGHYGVDVAGGQDQLKGKMFRIGHLGAVDAFDVLHAIGALGMSMRDLGRPVDAGAGVAAALEAMAPAMSAAPVVSRYSP